MVLVLCLYKPGFSPRVNFSMKQNIKIAFIGGGNMAMAMASGMIGTVCQAGDILVIDINTAGHARWHEKGVKTSAQVTADLAQCKVWIYAVKPQNMHEAIESSKTHLQPDTLVISIAAGLNTQSLSTWLGSWQSPSPGLVRVMPNTPALIGKGVTGLYAMPSLAEKDILLAEQILSSIGSVVRVQDENLLDAVTALSGSGPAYVFLLIESLIDGAKALGLEYNQAKKLAIETVLGSAGLAAASDLEPGTLRENVTSKGGTTAAALAVFEQHAFRDTVKQAMKAASDRAVEMSRELGKT